MKLLRNSQIKRKMSKRLNFLHLKIHQNQLFFVPENEIQDSPALLAAIPEKQRKSKRFINILDKLFFGSWGWQILTVNWRREFWKENLPKECTWYLLIICEGHQLFSGSMLFTSIQEEEDNLDVQHGSLMFFESFHFIQEFLRNLRWFSSIQSLTCFLKRLICLLSCSD